MHLRALRSSCLAGACALPFAVAACGGSSSGTSGTGGTVSVAQPTATTAPSSLSGLQHDYVTVIDRVAPQVVQITTREGLGSGVVLDDKGDVVTNWHVVSAGGPLRVTDSHGRGYPATLVGHFAPDDLAVVHAEGASLPAATFAPSGKVQVGDIVLALGNPLGLRSSVTNGIISALGRTVSEPGGAVLPNVIQTSAPINPGNSGGALVDLEGQVVGIPTLAAVDPQLGGSAAPGIGFAISAGTVTDIASQILAHGHVVSSHRAFLGVQLTTGAAEGAVIVAVQSSSPASKAGLTAGDLITAIDGHPVAGAQEAAEVLAGLSPGQRVKLDVTKPDGHQTTVSVTLGSYPGTNGG